MGLLNAETFIAQIQEVRSCWILGKAGGHKTSLAWQIAGYHFAKAGYWIISNNKCVWNDRFEDVKMGEWGQLRVVIVCDEGGKWLGDGGTIDNLLSYPAKMDMILLIPSITPPNRKAQILTCQPLYSLKAAGIPLVIYKWRIKIGAFQDGGTFFWWRPSKIYGVYSRQDPGKDPEEILRWYEGQVNRFREKFGYTGEQLPKVGSSAQDIIDAIQALTETIDDNTLSASRRGRSRRRI